MKNTIQNILQTFGYRLQQLPTKEQKKQIAESEIRKIMWLKKTQIKTIFDIGANTGQFARYINQIFPQAILYSFEPLEDCYNELVSNFQEIPQFQAFNVALGNETTQMEIYRSQFSPSSSLLAMAELHKDAFPHTQDQTVYKVDVVRLSDIAQKLHLQKPILIKLDVQGFEDKVIAGGKDVIEQAEIIIIEMSVEELYENQPLFDDIYKILVSLGFKYKGSYEQLHSPQDGRILQIDGIFMKR